MVFTDDNCKSLNDVKKNLIIKFGEECFIGWETLFENSLVKKIVKELPTCYKIFISKEF